VSTNVLGFDYGSKRIGVAVGNTLLGTAAPLTVIKNTNGTPDWAAIDALVNEWQPKALIVGWPLTIDGEMQDITHHVKGFVKRLERRFEVPVLKADERFSSRAAQELNKSMRSRGQRRKQTSHADIDTLAAALILESWFETTAPDDSL